jgi:hypothetical protein
MFSSTILQLPIADKKILKSVECPWRDFQRCGSFIAPLPINKKHQSDVKKVYCAIAKFIIENWPQIGSLGLCQSLPVAFRIASNFKGLSQNAQRADFAKNLRASLFNDDLANDTT